MDLENVKVLISVVETGSRTAAAASLGISRGTVRRRIEELEAQAGTALLVQTRDGIVPTQAGGALMKAGRRMMQEIVALMASVREVGGEPQGFVRLRLPSGILPHIVISINTMFESLYPKLSFRLDFSNDPLGGLLEDVDIAMAFLDHEPEGPWKSFKMFTLTERILGHRDYLDRRGIPTCIDDLHEHELFAWENPDKNPELWPTLDGRYVRVQPGMITSDILLLRKSVLAGLGLGFLPDPGFPDVGVDPSAVVRVLPDVIGRKTDVWISVPEVISDAPRIRTVLQYFEDLAVTLRAVAGASETRSTAPAPL